MVFTTELEQGPLGHEVSIGSLSLLVVAVASWVVWTPVNHLASEAHPGVVVLTANTFFAGLFVSGVVGTVINLVPLEFLPGAAIARWHKAAWAAIFSVAVFLLVQVMLLPAARSSRLGNAPLVTTIVLFAVFGAGSIAFHRYFVNRHRRAGERGEKTAEAEDAVEENTMFSSPPGRLGPGAMGPTTR